ncbi:MAG TPA: hypothetical protein ENK18_20175 [Deltaproteobacteria bacterium]|nr:hypothetical protein [Deltaproteobacteria bacterium]
MLAPYPTLHDVIEEAHKLGSVKVYGRSVEGRALTAFCVPGGGAEDGRPALVVTAAIHGLEHVGVAVAMEVLRRGPIPGADLWVCPVLNPDAYVETQRTDGAASVAALRRNANGVDLNRNFPLPWGARPSRMPGAGSSDPASATFRGTAPLSEPETHHLAQLLLELRPHCSLNLHSFMGTLICARVWRPGDWLGYRRLVRAFRRGQGGLLRYRRLGTPLLDVFTGELEDWQHHVLRCWGICVECFSLPETFWQHPRAPNPFWRFNPRDPGPVVARDAAGVRATLEASLQLPRPRLYPGAAHTLGAWDPPTPAAGRAHTPTRS